MHALNSIRRIAMVALLASAWMAQAQDAPEAQISPDLLRGLVPGGTKGVLTDCDDFSRLRNCKAEPVRVQRSPRLVAAPAPAREAAQPPAPVTRAVSAVAGYTGMRFGWLNHDGRPTARDHRFRTGDVVRLWLEVPEPGYVYFVNVDVNNKAELLDQAFAKTNRVQAMAQFVDHPGVERVYALYSPFKINEPKAVALRFHPKMLARSSDAMIIQFTAIDLDGRLADSGVAVSNEGRVGTKGMVGIATNLEGRQLSSVAAEPGGIAIMERAVIERFPVQVLSLDLIHVRN
jgi:hypothetical protein